MEHLRILNRRRAGNQLIAVALVCVVVLSGANVIVVLRTGANESSASGAMGASLSEIKSSTNAAGVPYVADTLVLQNNTLIPGNFYASNALVPVSDVYDGANGEVFVASLGPSYLGGGKYGIGGGALSVIADSLNSVVATIPLKTSPGGLAFDSGKGEIFVTSAFSQNVTVISAASGAIVAMVNVGASAGGVAYDSARGEVFVADGNYVSVISDSSNTVVNTIRVGSEPLELVYDSNKGEVFVDNYGSDNVSVISDSTDTVVANVAVGSYPEGAVYDSGKGEVFVANHGSENVSVIADATNKVVASVPDGAGGLYGDGLAYDPAKEEIFLTASFSSSSADTLVISDTNNTVVKAIPSGLFPTGVVYDGGRGEVFVLSLGLNDYSGSVSVISDATYKAVATIPVGGDFPAGLTYDLGKGEVFVASLSYDNVSVISDATNTVVASVPVGREPVFLAYDSANGQMFVANLGSNSVSVIADSNNKVVKTIPTGTEPGGEAFDSGVGEIFVANSGSNNVSVISGGTDTVVATISVGTDPTGVAYDSGMGEIFVANSGSNDVSVISDSTNTVLATVAVGSNPSFVAYDRAMGEDIVTNSGSNSVSLISDSNDTVVKSIATGTGPAGVTYDSALEDFFVANLLSHNVSEISGASNSVRATVQVGSTPSLLAYDSSNGYIYLSNRDQGTISIISPGPAASYGVTFTESGLPLGTSWSVVLNGVTNTSATSVISFTESNGTYPFSVVPLPGYSASPHSGSVTVSGTPVGKTVVFTPISTTYPVTFTEAGLPTGTEWYVNVTGQTSVSSTTRIASINLGNGTYSYSIASVDNDYTPSPGSGSLTVAGTALNESVTFSLVVYSVTFAEGGLPSGTNWSIILNGAIRSSTGTSIAFTETNGSYAFTVGAVPGFVANRSSGTVVVNGRPVSEPITWTPGAVSKYAVTFTESGLPSGTSWSITLNGTIQSSTTNTVTYAEPNGTYAFTVGTVTGYTASPASGSLAVSGKSVAQTIAFTPTSTGPPSYTILFDGFSSDTELNTSLWQIDSGILSNISSVERSVFNGNVIAVPPSPPLGSLGLTSTGLQIGATGAFYLEGVTSQIGLVPPFSIEVAAVGGGSSTGNPLALFVTDASARNMAGVFASNSAYVQDGAQLPTTLLTYPGSPTYVAFVNATVSGYTVTLLNAGTRVTQSGTWTSPSIGAYYLTLATYAGNFPGETGSPPFADTATYRSVLITSNQTWSLNVAALASGGGPDPNVQVSIANATGASESATTGGNGVATFTTLVQGEYSIVGTQVQSGITVSASKVVMVGNPLQPAPPNVATSLAIVAPSLTPLVVGINSVGGVSGYAPLVVTLDSAVSGGTGNYSYQWQVAGQTVGSSADLTYTYSTPGTIPVSLAVTSQGVWFGNPVPPSTMSVTTGVDVLNTPFFASIVPLQGYLNNLPFTSTNYVTMEASTVAGGAYLYLTPTGVYLGTNVTLLSIGGYTMPSVLRALGLATPYYEVLLNDSAGTIDTGLLIQGASTQEVNVALPPGTPTSVSALSGYHFTIRLNPYTSTAIGYDAASILLSVIGLSQTLLGTKLPVIMAQTANFIGSSLSGIVDLPAAGDATIIGSIISALPGLQASLVTFLASVGLTPEVLKAAQTALTDLVISYKMATIGFDLGGALGAMLSGGVREDFSIGSLQPMAQVSVSSSAQVPYVTVDPTTGTYGWSGAWLNGTGPFVHSAFTNSGYSFAGLPGDSYTLTVEAPMAVSSTSYTIAISQNGSVQSVAGTVQAGQAVVYHAQYSNGGLVVVKSTSSPAPGNGSGSPPWPTYAGVGIAAIVVVGVAVVVLRRRGKTPPDSAMSPSQPSEGVPPASP